MKNPALHRSLKARGWDTSMLASLIGSSRAQVCLTLNNTPGRGGQTRRKLAYWLSAGERALLGWDEHGNLISPSVPRGTNSAWAGLQKPAPAEAQTESNQHGKK